MTTNRRERDDYAPKLTVESVVIGDAGRITVHGWLTMPSGQRLRVRLIDDFDGSSVRTYDDGNDDDDR